jgi:hypothetical protein
MSFRSGFEQAEQHFLDAVGAGGSELLSDSGLQGCVADFDGHGWLLGSTVRERVCAIQQTPGGMSPWNPTSSKGSEKWGNQRYNLAVMPKTLAVADVPDQAVLKRAALLFNRVAIVPVLPTLYRLSISDNPEYFKRQLAELEWLTEQGVVFELTFEDFMAFALAGAKDDPKLLELFDSLPGALSDLLPKQNKYEMLQGVSLLCAVYSRLFCSGFSTVAEERDVVATSVFGSMNALTASSNSISRKSEVLDVILSGVPIPSEDTSWEQIIDFRSDPDSRGKFLALQTWITDMVHGDLTSSELSEKLEYLLHEYGQHMKLHQMKANAGVFQTITTFGAELAENLMKLKLRNTADLLFSAKTRKIALLEAELNAPGREIAYIFRARERFQDSRKY